MKHSVGVNDENGNTLLTFVDCSKKQAVEIAKKESTESNLIFISAFNGQCTVYLNHDGNYESTGKTW